MRCKQDYTVAYENGLLDISTLPLILEFPGFKVKATSKMLLFAGNRVRIKIYLLSRDCELHICQISKNFFLFT